VEHTHTIEMNEGEAVYFVGKPGDEGFRWAVTRAGLDLSTPDTKAVYVEQDAKALGVLNKAIEADEKKAGKARVAENKRRAKAGQDALAKRFAVIAGVQSAEYAEAVLGWAPIKKATKKASQKAKTNS